MHYLEPGFPPGKIAKSFFTRLHDELLDVEEFANLAEARLARRQAAAGHNEERPYNRLRYRA